MASKCNETIPWKAAFSIMRVDDIWERLDPVLIWGTSRLEDHPELTKFTVRYGGKSQNIGLVVKSV